MDEAITRSQSLRIEGNEAYRTGQLDQGRRLATTYKQC